MASTSRCSQYGHVRHVEATNKAKAVLAGADPNFKVASLRRCLIDVFCPVVIIKAAYRCKTSSRHVDATAVSAAPFWNGVGLVIHNAPDFQLFEICGIPAGLIHCLNHQHTSCGCSDRCLSFNFVSSDDRASAIKCHGQTSDRLVGLSAGSDCTKDPSGGCESARMPSWLSDPVRVSILCFGTGPFERRIMLSVCKSAPLSHARIVAPNSAGFMIMPKLGDAVGLSTIFQPLLPLPVHAHLENNETFIFHLRDVSMVFSFFLHRKDHHLKVTKYSPRMQTRSVVAASV